MSFEFGLNAQDQEFKTHSARCEILNLLQRRSRLLADKRLLGRWGERRSEKFLKRKGLRTLTRNFKCKTGEIDLVMVDADRTIVFVEVKTRADESFSPAESAITAGKKARMIRTARYFLASSEIEDRPLRIDVVTVILGRQGPVQIRHYQNAFVP